MPSTPCLKKLYSGRRREERGTDVVSLPAGRFTSTFRPTFGCLVELTVPACPRGTELQGAGPPARSEDKITVHFVNRDGETLTAKGKVGDSLLDVVIENNLDIDGFVA
ncbi:adrenodoxin, mitochondrial [Leptonychotes weddellii]|uniref:Adrenodoxin, mitochondrial n=1 Tax=Leptonychotes weddellii TaxID=9713 RepID=A0A7F8RD96_LEPWE|nr:adrenodoxin, mitochondrial [Leptonychotes weddellii]